MKRIVVHWMTDFGFNFEKTISLENSQRLA